MTLLEKQIIAEELANRNSREAKELALKYWLSNHPEILVILDIDLNVTELHFPEYSYSSEYVILDGKVRYLKYQPHLEQTPIIFELSDFETISSTIQKYALNKILTQK